MVESSVLLKIEKVLEISYLFFYFYTFTRYKYIFISLDGKQ